MIWPCHNWPPASKKCQFQGAQKCSKKVLKTVDSYLPVCNIGRTHGKHITTEQEKMRTKALLSMAALAVGLTSSMAQVYSLNVVGYVNVPLQANKLHFLSLPLAPTDNNYAISNTIVLDASQMFANLYTWTGTAWSSTVPSWDGTAWDQPATVVPQGAGFFLASQAASTLTFVGQVTQGTIAYSVPAGLSTLANKVPVSANFPGTTVGAVFDNIYTWDLATQRWAGDVWSQSGSGWDNGVAGANPAGPLLNPGDAVFYQAGAALNFSQNFTVQ
jgi:hypothetical protein